MAKKDWLIFKVEGNIHTLTDDNEKCIRSILLDCYQPFTMVQVYDYLTGCFIDELTIDALYGEKQE